MAAKCIGAPIAIIRATIFPELGCHIHFIEPPYRVRQSTLSCILGIGQAGFGMVPVPVWNMPFPAGMASGNHVSMMSKI